MSNDELYRRANAGITSLTPYQPGKPVEEVQREFGLDSVVKLASNENPLGAGASVRQTVVELSAELGRYPDGAGFELKQAIARYHKVNAVQVTLGNGTNELLNMIARLFLAPGSDIVFSQHAFIVYKLASILNQANAIEVPAKNYGHDLDAIADAIRPESRLVFLANPNNPTGSHFDAASFQAFMARVPSEVMVVLDEAYFDYVPEQERFDGVDRVAQYPNLIVTRTFSKAYGLGGLRIGYAISSAKIADWLNRSREPFNTNIIAQAAATAALVDQDHVRDTIACNAQGMVQLSEGLKALGLAYLPSVANFFTVNVGDGVAVAHQLLTKGVIVRAIAEYGMPEFVRVSVGLPEENQRFLDAVAEVIASD